MKGARKVEFRDDIKRGLTWIRAPPHIIFGAN
jgi:hypothetical protein